MSTSPWKLSKASANQDDSSPPRAKLPSRSLAGTPNRAGLPSYRDRDRVIVAGRIMRILTGRKIGIVVAALLASASLLMIITGGRVVQDTEQPAGGGVEAGGLQERGEGGGQWGNQQLLFEGIFGELGRGHAGEEGTSSRQGDGERERDGGREEGGGRSGRGAGEEASPANGRADSSRNAAASQSGGEADLTNGTGRDAADEGKASGEHEPRGGREGGRRLETAGGGAGSGQGGAAEADSRRHRDVAAAEAGDAGATDAGSAAAQEGEGLPRKTTKRSKPPKPPKSGKGLRDGKSAKRREAPLLPFLPYDPSLPRDHPCYSFAHPPPPPASRRKTGFRPCPVCYLPVEEALAARPSQRPQEGRLRELRYATAEHPSERAARARGEPPRFGGHPTWEDRAQSFQINESMEVHCGFVWGGQPGDGTGYDISEEDRAAMSACSDVVVVSAIFGAYDELQQPANISERAKQDVCFVMFVDEPSYVDLRASGSIPAEGVQRVGLWRIVRVRNVPFEDPRRTGKIPKLLLHRLFPSARFSIWMDAKLQLVVDPYQVLERFLWRGNFTWAISKHYKRFDVFEEAEANKAAGKYANDSIDAQVEVYRQDGLTPYSSAKLPIISDVPEGCLIIREHTPLSRLYGCLWFNEVDRFTSRDQLSFGYTRDKILAQEPWRFHMFQDCERRNFVIQGYHKPVLLEKQAALAAARERAKEGSAVGQGEGQPQKGTDPGSAEPGDSSQGRAGDQLLGFGSKPSRRRRHLLVR